MRYVAERLACAHDRTVLAVSIPKILLLYGGDVDNIEPIHRLLSAELDRRKFGLVIIRVSGAAHSPRSMFSESRRRVGLGRSGRCARLGVRQDPERWIVHSRRGEKVSDAGGERVLNMQTL